MPEMFHNRAAVSMARGRLPIHSAQTFWSIASGRFACIAGMSMADPKASADGTRFASGDSNHTGRPATSAEIRTPFCVVRRTTDLTWSGPFEDFPWVNDGINGRLLNLKGRLNVAQLAGPPRCRQRRKIDPPGTA